MFNAIKIKTVLVLLMLSSQSFGFITVGVGGIGVCDFDNLTDAFIAAKANNDHFIRVTTQQTLHDTFIINDFIKMTGGYDDCGDAVTNTMVANLIRWSGDNTDTVVTIDVSGILPLVLLENFIVDPNVLPLAGNYDAGVYEYHSVLPEVVFSNEQWV